MTAGSDRDSTPGTGTLIAMMALFVMVGAPLVFYLWTTVNHLLRGQVEAGRLLIAVPVLLIFVGLLTILSRSIRRWDERLHT